ncbi:MAG: hypothetical protein Q9173_006202, partial [Seirophora scorigena]
RGDVIAADTEAFHTKTEGASYDTAVAVAMESSNGNENEDSEELPELEQIINPALSTRGMPSDSSPPKKRRRTDPPAALSKPFRSPFRTPLKKPGNDSQGTPALSSRSPNDHTATPNVPPSATPSAAPSKRRALTRVHHNGSIPSPCSSPAASPRVSQLQKQHTALLNQLSSLRASLETTSQALEIEASTADARLEALIQKWKTASRDAAEEVYTISKDRVDRAGGVKALKKQEWEMRQSREWEGDERKSCTGDDAVTEDKKQERGTRDTHGRKEEADQVAEDDEVRFTLYWALRQSDLRGMG